MCVPRIFDVSEKGVLHVVSFVSASPSTLVSDSPRGLDGQLVKRGFYCYKYGSLGVLVYSRYDTVCPRAAAG